MAHKTFRGGVHPPDRKELSKDAPIAEAPVPELLTVPLAQHIGKPAAAVVKPKDAVKRGQVIGEAAGFVSAAVHSPVSGTVKKIAECSTPAGKTSPAVLIENDGADAWAEGCDVERAVEELDAAAIREHVADAGIVGMGGATFPTHVKLSPPENKPIDTAILNGAECEPYLTADYRLMLESPATVVEGFRLVMKAVAAPHGIIALEDNKPEAAAALEQAVEAAGAAEAIRIELLETKYPQGGEKSLIEALLGREVPSGGLPMDVGVVVQNSGTAHAVQQACRHARPLTERIVSVTGEGVAAPQNLRARIGTPVRVLLEAARWREEEVNKLVCGGPMMGMAHYDLEMPVNKGMSGLLAVVGAERWAHRHCIRCGRCVEGCPMRLVPSELSILIEAGRFHDARDLNLLDCCECGACTYVCPSRRPILQWVKLAKSELNQERLRQMAREREEEERARTEAETKAPAPAAGAAEAVEES